MERKQIQKAVKNKKWQKFRLSLKGKPTLQKIALLNNYLLKNNTASAKIQVENYKNALKRGGLL